MKPIDLRELRPPDAKSVAKSTARAIRDAQPPLSVTVEWGTKLTSGARLMLLATVLAGLHAIVSILVPSVRLLLLVGALPLMVVISAIGLWLISTPDPRDGSWLGKRRWLIRASIVVSLSNEAVRLICMGLLWLSAVPESHVVLSYLLAGLLAMAGTIGGLWYLRGLASAIKDRFLQATFSVYMCLSLVLMALGAAMIFNPGSRTKSALEMLGPSTAHSPQWLPNILFLAAIFTFMTYVSFRLWRRLQRGLQTAREDASSPPEDAAGSSQGEPG